MGERARTPRHSGIRGATRRAKFLLISNMRSGSTWVETCLGSLPDVRVNYEIKWGASYAPAPLHFMLDREELTVSELLEEMQPPRPVAGSKFTFDPGDMTRAEFRKFTKKIGRDVRILHLTRDYRSIFLSSLRGFVHSVNADRAENLEKALRDGLVDADFTQALMKHDVAPETCTRALERLIENDLNARSLKGLGFPYMQVEYRCVPWQFRRMAAFVGSKANWRQRRNALKNPVVNRLPLIKGGKLLRNLEEFEPIFDAFEKRRRRDVLVPQLRPFALLWLRR